MTNYINWMQMNQVIRGDAIQTNGNPAGNYESPASGVASNVAPEGVAYAQVKADVAYKVSATNLDDTSGLGSGVETAHLAGEIFEIINVTPGKTTITMTDL